MLILGKCPPPLRATRFSLLSYVSTLSKPLGLFRKILKYDIVVSYLTFDREPRRMRMCLNR